MQKIELKKIKINPKNVRKTFELESLKNLAKDIDKNGLLQPILINQKYEIIAGERRYRAHKLLKKDTINAIVKNAKKEEEEPIMLAENIQRENLNPIEISDALHKIKNELKTKNNELAKMISKSVAEVSKYLSLQNFTQAQKQKIVDTKYFKKEELYKLAKSDNNVVQIDSLLSIMCNKNMSFSDASKILNTIKNEEEIESFGVESLKNDENEEAQKNEIKIGNISIKEKDDAYVIVAKKATFEDDEFLNELKEVVDIFKMSLKKGDKND
jgi:ParB family chromosome partitioning protein